MRFIHTGDIHWGMTPDADKPWGKERGYTNAPLTLELKKEELELKKEIADANNW